MTDETFRAALKRLRAERELSQRQLARLTHIDGGHLNKIENGNRPPPTGKLTKSIDEILNADGTLIGIAARERAQLGLDRRFEHGDTAASVTPAFAPHRGTHELPVTGHEVPSVANGTVDVHVHLGWPAVLRRTLIMGSAALAALRLVSAGTHSDTSGPLNADLVGGLVDVAARYRRAYHAVPASTLLPAALAHLDLVMSLRPTYRPDHERIPLVTAAGEMATLAGVIYGLDTSHHDEATSYLDAAWAAARSLENVELQTVILGCRSFVIAYGRADHPAGLECADFARTLGASGASPETRAWVAAVASERCASMEDLAGCQRRLDESRTILASSDGDEVVWRGVGGFDAGKLQAYEGGDMMRLRRYRKADVLLAEALNWLDPSMSRHRATALLDRAEARIGLGEIDAACADAFESLALVAHVQHTGHLDRLRALAGSALATGSATARTLSREVQLTRLDHGLPVGRPSQ